MALTPNFVPIVKTGGTTPVLETSSTSPMYIATSGTVGIGIVTAVTAGTAGGTSVFITTTGVGIGTTTPTQTLDVNGPVIIENGNPLYFGPGTTHNIYYNSNSNYLVIETGSAAIELANNGDVVLQPNSGDVYTQPWADYSGTSTIVGWSGTPSKSIYTKKLGKTVMVQFSINGTSNTTTATFTLPYVYGGVATVDSYIGQCLVEDNGTVSATPGQITFAGSTVTILRDNSGTAFTSSGTKIVAGQFWYQST